MVKLRFLLNLKHFVENVDCRFKDVSVDVDFAEISQLVNKL